MADENEIRSKFRRIGCTGGDYPRLQTIQCDFYAEFMRRVDPNAHESYAREWARRFRNGEQFHHADLKNKKVIFDIMLEGTGPGNAPHIERELLKRICKNIS